MGDIGNVKISGIGKVPLIDILLAGGIFAGSDLSGDDYAKLIYSLTTTVTSRLAPPIGLGMIISDLNGESQAFYTAGEIIGDHAMLDNKIRENIMNMQLAPEEYGKIEELSLDERMAAIRILYLRSINPENQKAINTIIAESNEADQQKLNQFLFEFEQEVTNHIIPAKNSVYYTVQSGDNLSKIAANHGVTLDQLLQVNPIPDPNKIYPGQQIVIP